MSPNQLEALLDYSQGKAATSPAAAAPLPLTRETFTALKSYSAQFYTTQPAEALRIAEGAYALSRSLAPPIAALGAWTLANALVFLERYAEADQLYTQVRQSYLAAEMVLEAARAGVGQVFVLAYLGRATQALDLATTLEAVLLPASQSDVADRERLANLLMNMGVAHELLGQYEETLAIYARQLELATALADDHLLAQAKHNRAYAYSQLNALGAAERDYLDAERLFAQSGARVDLIRLTMNYASLLASQGRLAEAKRRYQQAQALAHALAGLTGQAALLEVLIALVTLQEGEVPDPPTLERLEAAQRHFATHGPAPDEGLTWLVLGECARRRGAWDAAQAAYRAAHRLGEQGADRALLYQGWHGLAQVAAAQGADSEAIAHYEAALHAIEGVRHGLRVDTWRASFLADKLIVYQAFTHFYLDRACVADAFEIAERARARLIREQLAFRLELEAAALQPGADATLQQLATALTTTLQLLESQYQQQQAQQLYGDDHPQAQQAETISQLEEEVQSLTGQIQQRQPRFAQVSRQPPLPLSQLCDHLDEELLLYYHLHANQVGLFCIDRHGIRTHGWLAPLATIKAATQAFTTAVERTLELLSHFGPTRAERYLPALLADANTHLTTLYNALLAPVAQWLQPEQPLLIAPDGALHYVPFHALYTGTAYLIELQAVSYLPSATLLDLCRRGPSAQTSLLLCGYNPDRLQAVTVELAALQQVLPQATVYEGEQVTTARLLAAAPQQRLLHLATHAHFRADRPMLSAFTLADRRLTLAEIARLPLDLDLAVLSGCETGHGELQGADLLSLASGFLGAGTRSLVVSRWRVADAAAAQQMSHFYQALRAGAGRNLALRSAQLALLQGASPLYRHPAFWAPFSLIGDWQAVGGFG